MIVIDLQIDVCHCDGRLASSGVPIASVRRPIAPQQQLLPRLRAAGVPVIWLNWGHRSDCLNLSPSLLPVYNPDGRSGGLGDVLPMTGSRVLEKGSLGFALVDGLEFYSADIQSDPYRMIGFCGTPLDLILRNLGHETLQFAGVHADQCVLCSLQDAEFSSNDCVLIANCKASALPDFCWDATLYNVRQFFGFTSAGADFTALPDLGMLGSGFLMRSD